MDQTEQANNPNYRAGRRRLDWRFLLPAAPMGSYRHLLLLGGPKGLGERIVETHFAARVSCALPVPGSVDAVVMLHDSPVPLEHVAASLAPGGVYYEEIDRRALARWHWSPARLRRRLQRAGLTLTGYYWAAPDFDQCRRYIPLDVPGVADWYFSSLFVAGTPMHRMLESITHRAAGANGHRLGWFAPCLSITAVKGPAPHTPPSVLNHPQIRDMYWHEDARPMLLTSGQDDASRLVMLPFSVQRGLYPQAVIKIATHPRFNPETEHEQAVLHEVRSRVDAKLRQAIPEPLGAFHYGDLAVGVESCAPGRSLWASSGEWRRAPERKIADAELAAQWLTEFHRQTATCRLRWDAHAGATWLEPVLTAYAQQQKMSAAEIELFAAVRSHAQALTGVELPLVWQHHDFAPWNLYRAGNQLTVIDWESNRECESTRASLPLCNLLYFLTYWHNIASHLYTEQDELAGKQMLFLEPDPANQYVVAARRTLACYMQSLQIDCRFLPLSLVYLWVEQVVYGHTRAQKLQKTTTNRSLKYVRLLAEHPDRLWAMGDAAFLAEFAR